jgi:hypothetical protein
MVYLVRSVLPSGTQARSSLSYESLDEAVRAAGAELWKGFVIDVWIEGPDGANVADMAEIMRQCRITEWRLRRVRSKLRVQPSREN